MTHEPPPDASGSREKPASQAVLRAQQARRLAEARRETEKAVPQMAELAKRLLNLGGVEVVFTVDEPDVDMLLARGRLFQAAVAMRPGAPSQCHWNVAHLPPRIRRCTGWALSNDGLWRQHSWGFDKPRARIVETTVERRLYYGVQHGEPNNRDGLTVLEAWPTPPSRGLGVSRSGA